MGAGPPSCVCRQQNASLCSVSERSLSSKGTLASLPPPKSLHLTHFARDSPAPQGHFLCPTRWLVPILGLCFGAPSSPASSVSFGDSQRLLVAGATKSTTWEGSACPRSSRVFVVSTVQCSSHMLEARVMSPIRVDYKMYKSVT